MIEHAPMKSAWFESCRSTSLLIASVTPLGACGQAETTTPARWRPSRRRNPHCHQSRDGPIKQSPNPYVSRPALVLVPSGGIPGQVKNLTP